jgi:hypothetical protein
MWSRSAVAAPAGFDIRTASASVSAAPTVGATYCSITMPARSVIGVVEVLSDQLDSATAGTITFDAGDAADADRYAADVVVAREAGTETVEIEPEDFHRYSTATAVRLTCTAAATTFAAGAITLTLYGYQAADWATLRAMVLRELGVLAEGETARAADDVLVRDALAEVHETLRGKGLANRQDLEWPVELVPLFAARPYAVMGARLLAPTFGLPAARIPLIEARANEAEREMRRQTRTPTAGGPVSLEPYLEDETLTLDEGDTDEEALA